MKKYIKLLLHYIKLCFSLIRQMNIVEAYIIDKSRKIYDLESDNKVKKKP